MHRRLVRTVVRREPKLHEEEQTTHSRAGP